MYMCNRTIVKQKSFVVEKSVLFYKDNMEKHLTLKLGIHIYGLQFKLEPRNALTFNSSLSLAVFYKICYYKKVYLISLKII